MNADSNPEIRSLASGIRSVAMVFVLILSYFSARLAFQINYFGFIFTDMLGGKPLPNMTTFVIQNNIIFVLLSLLVPVAAIVIVLAVRNHRNALFSLSALMIIAFLQMHVVWSALFAPFYSIIAGMRGE